MNFFINRGDENPFNTAKKTALKKKKKEKNWLEWVKTACPDTEQRRCLGERPAICVHKTGKFY